MLVFAQIILVSVLSFVCLNNEPGSLWFWISLGVILVLAGTTLMTFKFLRRPYFGPAKDEEDVHFKSRTALLFVHGMGVQDRYQMLDEVANALPRSTSEFAGKLRRFRADASANYLSLKLESKDKKYHRIDVHEAYYGSLFNRLAKLPETILFALKTLVAFVPTVATRLWKKRSFEAIYVVLALAILWQLIAGVYSGFIISNQTLVVKQAKAGEEANRPQPDSHNGPPSHSENELRTLEAIAGKDYALASTGETDDVAGTSSLPNPVGLSYPERFYRTLEFIKHSAIGAWNGTVFQRAIPLEEPLKYVKSLGFQAIAISAIYSIAFALLFLRTFSILFALIDFMFSGRFRLQKNSAFQIWRSQQWLNTTRSSFSSAMLPLLIVLILDPIQDLVLTQIFTTAALLVIALKGLAAWMTNFLGDVIIYATQNANAETDSAREQATTLVANRIQDLLKSSDYDRVIVMAHSLGTVVTLNAVRRTFRDLKRDTDLQKFQLFITVGSPLRKFRQLFRVPPYLWAFGDNNLSADKEIFVGEDNLYPGKLRWKNYWYRTDLFADRLAYLASGEVEKARSGLTGSDPVTQSEKYKEALQRARTEAPSELDLTGFRVRVDQDFELNSPIAIWSHSHYWLDPDFVDPLIHEIEDQTS